MSASPPERALACRYVNFRLKLLLLVGGPLVLALAISNTAALRTQYLLLSVLVVALAAGGSALLARRVCKSLAQLTCAARRAQEGNYTLPVVLHGGDEFGILAAAFNDMQVGVAERERRIKHQVYYDPLTGLPNRTLALDRLRTTLKRAARNGVPVAVLTLELEGFTAINDALGQHTGERVLRHAAERLNTRLQATDTAARLEKAEFLVVLENVSDDAAVSLAEDLYALLHEQISTDGIDLRLNSQFGLALAPQHGDQPAELLRRAETALHNAKTQQQRLAVYEEGWEESKLHRLALLSDLRQAVGNGQLELYYQPKLDLKKNQVVGAEALLRWHHPKYGFVPPDQFILPAEQSGNIRLVTKWVIGAAADQARRWRAAGIELNLAVNLSAVDLRYPDLPDYVADCLRERQLPADCLQLEISESTMTHDWGRELTVLERLRGLGIRLAIDDFGTGHSSLVQLKQLPFDELKIDRSLVREIDIHADDEAIVRTVIDLGRNLDLRVVAEGVENQAGLRLLTKLGCDLAQGYFIGRPMAADDFIARLQQNGAEPAAAASSAPR